MPRPYVMRLRRPRFLGLRTPVATAGQSARRLLLVGLASAALIVPVWAGTTQTYTGQRLADLILYGRFSADPAVSRAASETLATIDLALLATAALGILTIALARGGLGLGIGVLSVLGGANLTAQLLKDVLERPNLIGNATYAVGNSFPSGTVALAASIGFASVLVAPRRLRTAVAAAAAVLIAAVGGATITTGWHRLADVLGSVLISLAWAALVTAALVRAQGWMPRRTWGPGAGGRVTSIAAWAGLLAICGGAVGLGLALVDPVPLASLIATRAATGEAFVPALAIAGGATVVALAAYVWAMRGVALELPS
jgi:hypothetical protein